MSENRTYLSEETVLLGGCGRVLSWVRSGGRSCSVRGPPKLLYGTHPQTEDHLGQLSAGKRAGNLGSLPESSAACRESRQPAATTRVLLGQDLPACCRSFRQAAGIFGRLPKLMAVMVPKVEPGPAAGLNRRKDWSSPRQRKAAENARRECKNELKNPLKSVEGKAK